MKNPYIKKPIDQVKLDDRPIYYVYALFDAAGIPRYIGKGKANRFRHHTRPSATGGTAKRRFISRTLRTCGEVPTVIIRENLTEKDAFEAEIALISVLGRKPNGLLTNLMPGGLCADTESLKLAWSRLSDEDRHLRRQNISLGRLNSPTRDEQREARRQKQLERPLSERKAFGARMHALLTREHRQAGARAAGRRVWINDGTRNKRIAPESDVPSGWQRGRINYDPPCKYAARDTVWINNGTASKRHPQNTPIPAGWQKGRSPKVPYPVCSCGCETVLRSRNSVWAPGHYKR